MRPVVLRLTIWPENCGRRHSREATTPPERRRWQQGKENLQSSSQAHLPPPRRPLADRHHGHLRSLGSLSFHPLPASRLTLNRVGNKQSWRPRLPAQLRRSLFSFQPGRTADVISRRWFTPPNLERVPRPCGYATRHPRNHQQVVPQRTQFRCPGDRRGDIQDEYPPHPHRCAPTASPYHAPPSHPSLRLGTKFILLTSLIEPTVDAMLQKVYEIYAEAVMKNPFHTPEMPIRTEGFDTKITALLGGR